MKRVILVLVVALIGLTSCDNSKKKDCWWNVDNNAQQGWVVYTYWEDIPKQDRENYFDKSGYCEGDCLPHAYCLEAEIRVRP